MRSNWWRWLWGIIPLLLLGWLAVEAEHKRIERDLHDRSQQALASSGLAWAQAGYQGRDAVLSGRASDVADPDKAVDLLKRVWGVRVVDNRADLIDQVENYHWAVARFNGRVRLTGYVPNNAARQVIMGMAKASFPGFELQDRMKLGRGAPNQDMWLGAISFALKQLTSLKQGNARLDMLTLSISGEAEDANGYRTVASALGTPPKGVKLAAAGVTPPVVSPHVWSAAFDGKTLHFKGFTPSDAARGEILKTARAKLNEKAVADDTEPGDGVPAGWLEVAMSALGQILQLENGTAEIKDGVLTLSGLAPNEETAVKTRAAMKSLPQGFKGVEHVAIRPPAKPIEALMPPVVAVPDLAPDLRPPPPAPPVVVAPPAPQAPAQPPATSSLPDPKPAPPETRSDKPVAAKSEAKLQPPPAAPPPAPPPAPPAASKPAPEAKPMPPEVKAAVDACQTRLRTVALRGTILFRYGSAELSASSFDTLSELAAAAKDCPDMTIEIGGYASPEGLPQANLKLSQNRAQAVVAYFVKAGVDPSRLEAKGYGTANPVAPNTTAENMAKNRRIEFTVRPNANTRDAQRTGK